MTYREQVIKYFNTHSSDYPGFREDNVYYVDTGRYMMSRQMQTRLNLSGSTVSSVKYPSAAVLVINDFFMLPQRSDDYEPPREWTGSNRVFLYAAGAGENTPGSDIVSFKIESSDIEPILTVIFPVLASMDEHIRQSEMDRRRREEQLKEKEETKRKLKDDFTRIINPVIDRALGDVASNFVHVTSDDLFFDELRVHLMNYLTVDYLKKKMNSSYRFQDDSNSLVNSLKKVNDVLDRYTDESGKR